MNNEEKTEEHAKETEPNENAELEEALKEEPEELPEAEEALVEPEAETEEKPEEEAKEEEEEKPEKKKKKGKEEEIVEERVYTIPLGKATVRPPKKRAPRAIQLIQAFITKNMKLEMKLGEEEEEGELPKLTISPELNEKIWDKGIEKPPRKIRVRAAKDSDGNVTVYLAEGE
jgi:large subunit ribosomal protein L31e